MQSVYQLYALFALATAIAAHLDLIVPSLNAISNKELNVVRYKNLTYLVLFIFSLVFAPAIFYVYLRPNASIVFRDSLIATLSEE